MRLQDFVAELARYRRGFLRCDPSVANLIVSGVYSVDNTDATIASLVDALPIRVQYVSRFWVSIHAI
jgi:transmembrane sensor